LQFSRRNARTRWAPLAWVALTLLAVIGLSGQALAKTPAPKAIRFGEAVIALNGPWKFNVGDDPTWSDPSFDDSKWEVVDLTPTPGAHDTDVGIKSYVPGWGARGHKGYAGVAWYRDRVTVGGAGATPLAIAGPASVDGAYQLFVDGTLVGGSGDFQAGRPVVHETQPQLFQLPTVAKPGKRRTISLALRVWSPPELVVGGGGGVRVAPLLGRLEGVEAVYDGQWQQIFEGYVVDYVEALGLLALACMVVGLLLARPADPAYRWLAAALVLTALARGNQCVYAWTQFESLETYGVLRYVVLTPLALAAWTLAWRHWFGGKASSSLAIGLTVVLAGVTGLLMAVSLGALPWFEPESLAHRYFHSAVFWLRLVLAALYLFVVAEGGWRNRNLAGALAVLAAILAAVGLFADELTMLHLKGIWFPFGVGVSRTEYAYAALIVTLFALILQRFVSLARHAPAPLPAPDLWGTPPPHTPAAEAKRHVRRAGRNPDARPAASR